MKKICKKASDYTSFRDLRISKGLSQIKLGEIVGVTRDSISLYEQGKRMPSAGVLLDLAEFFDLTPRKLYDIIESK